ncbi:MAG: hypothetical protein HUJ90_01125, partial [Bacteroidales bacterium]|nr:hypothetical protein [Bacteroidales bacterium]
MSLKNFALKKPENESGYRWGKPVALFFSGLSIFLVYSLLYTAVFKFEPPKTLYLESKNRALIERIEKIDQIVARQNQ